MGATAMRTTTVANSKPRTQRDIKYEMDALNLRRTYGMITESQYQHKYGVLQAELKRTTTP